MMVQCIKAASLRKTMDICALVSINVSMYCHNWSQTFLNWFVSVNFNTPLRAWLTLCQQHVLLITSSMFSALDFSSVRWCHFIEVFIPCSCWLKWWIWCPKLWCPFRVCSGFLKRKYLAYIFGGYVVKFLSENCVNEACLWKTVILVVARALLLLVKVF